MRFRAALRALGALAGFLILLVPLFERFAPRKVVHAYWRLVNPLFLPTAGIAPGYAVIETTGRKSGLPRRTPVAGGKRGRVVWLVAGLGHRAQWVRNLDPDPSVRVRVGGHWHPGTAHVVLHDASLKRMLKLNPINAFFLWVAGGDHTTVRIDLH